MDKSQFETLRDAVKERAMGQPDPLLYLAEEIVIGLITIDTMARVVGLLTGTPTSIVSDEALTLVYEQTDDFRA